MIDAGRLLVVRASRRQAALPTRLFLSFPLLRSLLAYNPLAFPWTLRSIEVNGYAAELIIFWKTVITLEVFSEAISEYQC